MKNPGVLLMGFCATDGVIGVVCAFLGREIGINVKLNGRGCVCLFCVRVLNRECFIVEFIFLSIKNIFFDLYVKEGGVMLVL